jgi:pyridoxine 4-dehydrogenase
MNEKCRSESRKLENLKGGDIELSEAEMQEINDAISNHGVKGGRYNDSIPDKAMHLWG